MATSGSFPAFVPFPPAPLRLKMSTTEWDQSLDAWTIMAEAVLSLEEGKQLESFVQKGENGVKDFLTTYMTEHSDSSNTDLLASPKSIELHKTIYLLVRKLLTSQSTNEGLLSWNFLSQTCVVYQTVSSLGDLFARAWKLHLESIETGLAAIKQELVKGLDQRNNDITIKLDLISHLISTLSPAGQFFAIGSDLLDGLISLFPSESPKSQKIIITFTYFLLISLVKKPQVNHSLLSTHLYSLKSDASKRATLKSQAPSTSISTSLLQALVSDTDFLSQLKMYSSDSESDVVGDASAPPPQDHSAGLMEFRVLKPKSNKSKKAGAQHEVHFHKETTIFEIQDLFPNLGSGFIAKCLDFYKEDKELVIAHLLEDSLPPGLASADRTEVLDFSGPEEKNALPERKNIYDNDDLDKLVVSTKNLHIGKSDKKYDEELEKPSSKAKILAALAAFDSDDDERDDTYDDVDDHVGASVDSNSGQDASALKDGVAAVDPEIEKTLFAAWKAEPKDLTRSMRFTSKRKDLKTKTGWTDEAIEGFGTMMGREPDREKKLEKRFGESVEWKGEQKIIERTAWRDEAGDEGGEEGEAGSSSRGGRVGGRGRSRGRGGRGGAAPSPVDNERARKNKEIRGRHNRREGHAKKMARGGFAPST